MNRNHLDSDRLWIAAGKKVKEKEYWLDKLAGELVKSSFPSIYEKETETAETSVVNFQFNDNVSSGLMKLSTGSDVRLHIVLTAVLTLLLGKYTGNHDIVLGTPILKPDADTDTDSHAEVINTVLVLRNQLTGDMTFKELLLQVRQTIIEADEHRNYPIELLVHQLHLPVHGDDFPLFDVAILLENIHDKQYLHHVIPRVIFSFFRSGESIRGQIEYRVSSYFQETIERIIGHFQYLVEVVLADADIKVSDIELLLPEEKSQLLFDFNNTKAEYPTDKTIHQLFEEQAARTPDRIAIHMTHMTHMTYTELNKKSNRLAHLLQAKGVGPDAGDSIVGIMIERSVEMIVGILGILKASATYLPIDINYPEERVRYMLADSNARILVSKVSGVSRDIEVIDLMKIIEPVGPIINGCKELPAHPTQLCYVIYTSGTTGRPKGVVVEHRQAVNTLLCRKEEYKMNPGVTALQLFSFAFDGFVTSFFTPLISGAKVVLLSEKELKDPAKIKDIIVREKVSHFISVPALYQAVIENMSKEEMASLRSVTLAGDKVPSTLIQLSKSKNQNTEIAIEYGVTEAAVMSTLYRHQEEDSKIKIGKPVWNTNIYILNEHERLQPIGIAGELCIGGDGVSRGYLNNPELTAEKFDQDFQDYQDDQDVKGKKKMTGKYSFTSLPLYPSTSLYRTGDLARWLPDGNIEFLGRIDHQIKLRGFRIELGEIESQLLKHDQIKEAVVHLREDKQGTERYLCAYFVPGKEASPPASELREYLSGGLPQYMIPSYFVPLDRIPLTPNGKIDREKLPEPEVAAGARYETPGDEMEEKLVEIWSKVLNIDHSLIGVNANFFELGGHSLKATTMVQHVYKAFGINIEIEDVFTHSTLREMARRIKESAEKAHVETEITPVGEEEDYPLSHAQRRLWVLCQFEKDSTAYNMPAAFTLSGSFQVDVFTRAAQVLADRHESLRTVFILKDGEPRQKIVKDFIFHLPQVDLRSLDEKTKIEKARQIYLEDANRAFNLERGSLFRFQLVRLEDETYMLTYNMHHIVNDGWSQGIITNELITLYNAFLKGAENPLPPLEIQYKDYTCWHNHLIETHGFQEAGAYWLEKFKDKPNGIDLPLDYLRKAIQTFNGGRVVFSIDREKTALLHRLSLEQDATLFMGLLTLLSVFLYRYSGQTDIIIGAPIANRKRTELHPIVGFLVNTLVYRNEITPGYSFREQLKVVKKESLTCYQYQDYPFDLLVEQLELDRDLSQSPLFNVMVAHNNAETEDLKLALEGVEISPTPFTRDFNMSKFDLIFFMDELEDEIQIRIEFNSDLFERITIERMRDNFLTLVEEVAEGKDVPISALNILSENQQETVVHRFNHTAFPFGPLTLQELFEQQVETSGDKTAVVSPGEGGDYISITYSLLNKKINQLALHLREKYHVKPNDIIGVSMDRSIDMIVVLWGIIKAGAAYLTVDPTYPRDRVLHVLANSQSHLLVIDKMRLELFGGYPGEILNIHSLQEEIQQQGADTAENPPVVNTPLDILYVNYTSGSTGTPNGAMLSHDCLTNLIQWQNQKTTIDCSLSCLQFTSINFCVSFQEIMGTLISGGKLYLIGDIERQGIDYLMDYLSLHQIEILFLPFSYLNFLFNESGRWDRSFRHNLKHIITAGEQLKVTAGLKRFLDLNPGLQLHNHYGSTEMHVVTSYTLDAASAAHTPIPPAGKPITNVKIFILDEHFNPVPVGVYGELCVAGSSEILGYINNEELTGKKLMKHSELSGIKLYRSGDIGRWLPDGNIQLRGRKDSLVKVRGFRVEPGEIESKILALQGVRECVVVVKEDKAQQKYLAAYVVVDDIEVSEIKQRISSELPQYMIPTFILLDCLPLMPNGKVDREKLPEPQLTGREERVIVPPSNEVEKKLAAIWSQLLEIEQEGIGVHDNFFELGGHSLKAATMVSKIHKELDAKVELLEIFKNPTIREISPLIKAIHWANIEETRTEQEQGEMEEMVL